MNHLDFQAALQPMVDAFPRRDIEAGISVLYRFFGERRASDVSRAALACAREEEHWPVPKVFGAYLARETPVEPMPQQARCPVCDGFGRVYGRQDGYEVVWRAGCGHGRQVAQAMAREPSASPGPAGEAPSLAERIAPKAEVTARGLAAVYGAKGPGPGSPQAMRRIWDETRELLGPARFDALLHATPAQFEGLFDRAAKARQP